MWLAGGVRSSFPGDNQVSRAPPVGTAGAFGDGRQRNGRKEKSAHDHQLDVSTSPSPGPRSTPNPDAPQGAAHVGHDPNSFWNDPRRPPRSVPPTEHMGTKAEGHSQEDTDTHGTAQTSGQGAPSSKAEAARGAQKPDGHASNRRWGGGRGTRARPARLRPLTLHPGHFSFSFLAMPVMVPPVPAEATSMSSCPDGRGRVRGGVL